MRLRNLELWLALAAILVITVFYLGYAAFAEVPAASGLFGHSLGIVGFILMLMTEVLYSLRKRYLFARWGRMEYWLSFHIFTGLVGPYMVLLHTSWKFNGLAGVLMLMTIIIVASGFVGRYFYTAIPRSVDGVEIERERLQMMIAENQKRLDAWREAQPELVEKVDAIFSGNTKTSLRRFDQLALQNQWQQLVQGQSGANRSLLKNLREVWERQRILSRQLEGLATARRLLAIWHTIHVPFGVALFTVAFIHIGAALYYATLLR